MKTGYGLVTIGGGVMSHGTVTGNAMDMISSLIYQHMWMIILE